MNIQLHDGYESDITFDLSTPVEIYTSDACVTALIIRFEGQKPQFFHYHTQKEAESDCQRLWAFVGYLYYRGACEQWKLSQTQEVA